MVATVTHRSIALVELTSPHYSTSSGAMAVEATGPQAVGATDRKAVEAHLAVEVARNNAQ